MADGDRQAPSWWRVAIAVARAVLTAAILVSLYYLLPLDSSGSDASTIAKFGIGFVVLVGLMTWQVRAITHSDTPGLRALEGLFLAVPLFLLLFAATYFLMGQANPSDFSAPLTRTDALYFTVTIFSTVGFGDLAARAEGARLVVTAQMILDLVILGVGVKIILGAAKRGRERITQDANADPAVG
jgi:voltage-gated potassium channel